MSLSLSQLDRLSQQKAARARKLNQSPKSLLQTTFLMECRRCGCDARYSGQFGKSKKKKTPKICSHGLTKHLNASKAKAHLGNFDKEQTPQNNCYLWYRQERLVDSTGDFDLSTSRYIWSKTSSQILSAPATVDHLLNLRNNPFGLMAKSTILTTDDEFGPKGSYQEPPEHETVANVVALNNQLAHIHLENRFSAEAIHDHVLLTNLAAADDESDVDAGEFDVSDNADWDEELDAPTDDEAAPSEQLDIDGLSAAAGNEVGVSASAGDAEVADSTNVRTTLMDLLQQHQDSQKLSNFDDPQLRMEVSLMELCLKHRLPLSAADDFIDWARNCSKIKRDIFDAPTRKREKVLDDCRRALGVHGKNDFKETIIEWLPSRKPTSCFIRGFLQNVFELLHDTDIVGVGGSNLAFPHPTDPFRRDPDTPLERVSELCHASWYRQSADKYCTKENEIFVPILLAADASPCDGFARLKVAPLLMTFGIINKATRRKRHSWKVLAHLLDEDAESDKHSKPLNARDKLQNLHNTIALVLQELKELHESGDSIVWELDYGGKMHTVHIRFGISFFVSDTEFHDKLCLSKGNYTETSKGPCRICNTHIKDLVDVEMFELCDPYDPKELDPSPSYQRPDEHFENLGQHRCLNAFYPLPMGANENNIHLATPPECLHAIEKGAQVRAVEALLYAIKNGSKIEFEPGKFVADKDKFQGIAVTKLEHLAKRVGACIQRQSQRDKPRSSFGNGHFEKTKKFARENAGGLLNLLLVILSDRGRRILLEERGIHPEFLHKTARIFELLLQIDAWMKLDSYPVDHIGNRKRLSNRINEVVQLIAETCCREGMGARLIKNHLLLHLPQMMEMYGPPSQWDSGPIEEFHKFFSKLPAKLTQRIVRVFQKQLADRQNEIDIIAKASRYTNKTVRLVQCGSVSIPQKPTCGGSFFSVGSTVDGKGAMKWDGKRNKGKPPHHQQVLNFACRHILQKVTRRNLRGIVLDTIKGFTEYKKVVDGQVVTFRANSSYLSNSGQQCYQWYDWAMVQRGENSIVPGRILMFLSLEEVNSPISAPNGVFNISENDTPVAIMQLFKDEPVANFRQGCSPQLEGPYSSMIEFGRISSEFDIVPCEKIVAPVMVVPNLSYEYEDELDPNHPEHGSPSLKRQRTAPNRSSEPLGTLDGSDGFFVVPSRRGWAQKFEQWIDEADVESTEEDDEMAL